MHEKHLQSVTTSSPGMINLFTWPSSMPYHKHACRIESMPALDCRRPKN